MVLTMAMKSKKKTTPKVVPIIPPVVGAVAGVVGRAAASAAAKNVAKKAATAAVTKSVKNNVKKVKTPKKSLKPNESDISYALRHGRITKEEAAALDPKKFKILLDDSKTRRFNFNTKKYEPKKKGK
jgi:hypothetical protein